MNLEKIRKFSYPAILVAEFLAIMGFAASGPLLPSYLRQLGLREGPGLSIWSGWTTSLPALMLALCAPLWGILADRIGRKPMLLRAMLGGSIVVFFIALAQSPWQLLLLRSIQGVFTGTVSAATVLVASISPVEKLGSRLGLLHASVFGGNSLGPLFGGLVAEAFGNRAAFLLTSLLLLLGSLCVIFLVFENFKRPEAFGRTKNAPGMDSPGKPPLPGLLGGMRAFPLLVPLFAVVLMYQLAGSNVAPILPLFIEELAHDPQHVRSIAGLIIGAASLGAALAAALSGRISDRLGHVRVLIVSLCAAGICHFVQALARTPWDILAWRAVEGLFLGATMPSVNALIATRTEAGKRGAAYGFSTSAGQIGTAFGPMMGAGLSAAFGFRPVFALTGALLVSTALAVALLSPGRKREKV